MRPLRTPQYAPIRYAWIEQLTLSITRRGLLLPITAIILIIGLTGGTALAAEDALPGDPLYAIKIYVNEEVRAALAFSPEAVADWEIERTERRLEEASTLAVTGALTDANRAMIENNLSARIALTEKSAAALETRNDFTAADEIGARLTSVLEAHENILLSVRTHVDDATQPQIDSLLVKVGDYVNTAVSIKENSEMEIAMDSERGRKATVAQQKIAAQARIKAALSFIDQADTSIAPELVTEARTHLQNAQESYAVAEAALQSGESDSALVYFNGALRTAINTKASLSAQMNLINTATKQSNYSEKKTAVKNKTVDPNPTTATLMMTATITSTTSTTTSEKDYSSRAILRSVIDTLREKASDTNEADEQDTEERTIIHTDLGL